MESIKRKIIPSPQSVKESSEKVFLAKFGKSRYDISLACEKSDLVMSAHDKVRSSIIERIAAVPVSEEMTDWTVKYDDEIFVLEMKVDPSSPRFSEMKKAESYYIDINASGAVLCGYDDAGLFYAAVTLSHLLEEECGSLYLPCVEIDDYPEFVDRGHFLECRYGSDFMTKQEYFDAIDYFADMKINNLTVGIYGCWCTQYDRKISEYLYLPIKKYPELKTPRCIKYYSVEERKWIYKKDVLPTMFEEDYLSEIMAYAKKKNITIKPLFNSLGHNTLIPRIFPEISARDENGVPTGHYFCVSDENTYKVMFDIYDELIDNYMLPNGITAMEIGLDEVTAGLGENPEKPHERYSPHCQCEKCRSLEFKEIMLRYIEKVCQYLKKKGIKSIYIYQDMLQFHFDCINEELVERFKKADIYDVVVIDWWSYRKMNDLFRGKADGVNNLFRSIVKPMTGYYHWMIPMEYNENVWGCAKLAYERGFEGIESYCSFDYSFDKSYLFQAELSWNKECLMGEEWVPVINDFIKRYAYRNYPHAYEEACEVFEIMHNIMEDASDNMLRGVEYYLYSYVRDGLPYPRRFPEEIFKMMLNARARYTAYFERIIPLTEKVIEFFEEQEEVHMTPSLINKTWLASALHYYTLANEYYTLLNSVDAVNNGGISADEFLTVLDELIFCREDLMKFAENARIEANKYLYLRNLSVGRQYLVDIRNGVLKNLEEGKEIKIDLTNLGEYKSEGFTFLQ